MQGLSVPARLIYDWDTVITWPVVSYYALESYKELSALLPSHHELREAVAHHQLVCLSWHDTCVKHSVCAAFVRQLRLGKLMIDGSAASVAFVKHD